MELGPCRVTNATGKPEFFAEGWNNNANVFFIDQPINVGYSYSQFGETVYTTEEAAVDVAKFVFLFFENFPQFKGRAFHMAGESYGVSRSHACIPTNNLLTVSYRVATFLSSQRLSMTKMRSSRRTDTTQSIFRLLSSV